MRTWRNENYKFYSRKTYLLCILRWGTQAPLFAEAPALAKVAERLALATLLNSILFTENAKFGIRRLDRG